MKAPCRFPADQLRRMAQKLLVAAGTPAHIADTVADVLVDANLAGHDSHGVQFVPLYLERIEGGEIDSAAEPQILHETAGTLFVDLDSTVKCNF